MLQKRLYLLYMTDAAKIDKILDSVTQIKIELAKSIVHQENHAKKLEEHELKFINNMADIKILNDYKNQLIGKSSVIALVFGAVGAGISFLIKHIST